MFGVFVCSEACSESQSLDLKKNWPDPQVEEFSCKTSIFQRRTSFLIVAVFGCVQRIVFGEHVFDCVPVFVLYSRVRIVFVTVSMKCSESVFGHRTICVRHQAKKGVFEGHLRFRGLGFRAKDL